VSIRRKQCEAIRKVKAAKDAKKAARDAKKAAQASKGKSPRVNYKKMSSVSYSALRQLDWYTSQLRSNHIEDHRFRCMEQLYIYQDIFAPMSKPIRLMHPIDLAYLKSKEYFVPAVQVVERLGLTGLMTCQCNYDPQLILQFYTTLSFTGDDDRMLIRLKRIYNLLCSMLVFTSFA
jgi:hypothetical protein